MSETKTPAAAAHNAIVELKVSGHLMTMDAGLFCIFTPPGSPVPDNNTGLPGIRLSVPPGPAFRPEAVSISTFRDDGWLGGPHGAALVRVTRGPAQVLVTIYQAPNTKGEPPKLQFLRLGDAPQPSVAQPAAARVAAPATAPVPQAAAAAKPAAPTTVPAPPSQNTPAGAAATTAPDGTEIVAHIQGKGDVAAQIGEWVGTEGSKQWVEGFAIAPHAVIKTTDIEYQAVLGRGWLSPWAEGGQFCGSRGMSLPILGLRVRLRGDLAETHDCILTATFVDGSKVGPLDNGEPAQAETLAPLEAFRVVVSPRAAAKPAKAPAKPAAKAPPPKAPVKPVKRK